MESSKESFEEVPKKKQKKTAKSPISNTQKAAAGGEVEKTVTKIETKIETKIVKKLDPEAEKKLKE